MDNFELWSSLFDGELSEEGFDKLFNDPKLSDECLAKLEAYQIIRDTLAGGLPQKRNHGLWREIDALL